MTVKEAKIILLCNNIVELIFAQTNGVFSKETLDLDNDEEDIDLDELKKEALPIILNHLEKQELVIDAIIQEHILFHKPKAVEVCSNTSVNQCNSFRNNGGCNECVKQYYYRKMELGEDK